MQIADNVFLNVDAGIQHAQHTPKEGDTHIDLYWSESDLCWKMRVAKYLPDDRIVCTNIVYLQRLTAINYSDSDKFYKMANGLPS